MIDHPLRVEVCGPLLVDSLPHCLGPSRMVVAPTVLAVDSLPHCPGSPAGHDYS
jgi:hypothetical protein